MAESGDQRLNKALSASGYCSRREADRLMEQGRVEVNGEIVGLGHRVMPYDKVVVDGRPVKMRPPERVYIALNKPRGIICTTDRKAKDNVVDYIDHVERIFPVGRLDVASEGLILLTNDGDIVNRILRVQFEHEKEYIVRVDKPITEEFIQGMANGVPILDTITKKCEVEKLDERFFRIVLTQGLNRQIRRMCEHFDYTVTKLKRIRIMNINLDIPYGEWRELQGEELVELKAQLAD